MTLRFVCCDVAWFALVLGIAAPERDKKTFLGGHHAEASLLKARALSFGTMQSHRKPSIRTRCPGKLLIKDAFLKQDKYC